MPRVADTREAAADGASGQRGNRTTAHLRCRIVPVPSVARLCSIHHCTLGITAIYSSFTLNQDWGPVSYLNDDRRERIFSTKTSMEHLPDSVMDSFVHTKTLEVKLCSE